MGGKWYQSKDLPLALDCWNFIFRFKGLLHLQDKNTWKVAILFLQEIKGDVIFRHAQLTVPRRREELQPRIQAHLLSVVEKICALLEYRSVLIYMDALTFLQHIHTNCLMINTSIPHLYPVTRSLISPSSHSYLLYSHILLSASNIWDAKWCKNAKKIRKWI